MPLKQANPLTRETFETSSTGALLTLLEKPWDRFPEKTESSHDVFEGRHVFPPPHVTIVRSLDESNSTRADRPKLPDREELYKRWQQKNYSFLLAAFTEKLQKISLRENNWDRKGFQKPNVVALYQAYINLDRFLKITIDNGRIWKPPFISSDEDGYITIQWNCGDHELHLEISDKGTEYIKVWGANIEHEMHLGILKENEFLNLWDWLNE